MSWDVLLDIGHEVKCNAIYNEIQNFEHCAEKTQAKCCRSSDDVNMGIYNPLQCTAKNLSSPATLSQSPAV